MRQVALFGVENDALNLLTNLFVLFLVVIYFALIVWTYTDAKRRVADPLLVGCATAASFFPFFGTVVYLILRPPEFLADSRERELEMAAAEARLLQLNELSCPNCHHPIERAFLRCPNCLRQLKQPCVSCGKPLDPRWRLCPYCEHETGAPPPRRSRRPAAGRAGAAATRAVRSPSPEPGTRTEAGARQPTGAPRTATHRTRPPAGS